MDTTDKIAIVFAVAVVAVLVWGACRGTYSPQIDPLPSGPLPDENVPQTDVEPAKHPSVALYRGRYIFPLSFMMPMPIVSQGPAGQ